MKQESITLEALLESREKRFEKQKELRKAYSGHTLVCLTVIMPGNSKRNAQSLVIARAGVEAMRKAFDGTTAYFLERDLTTGYEAYLITTLSHKEAKHRACQIEDIHPLGRLFDLDVIGEDGNPLSRSEIGEKPRQCLLCENEVRFCMRNKTHTIAELLQRIELMIEQYV